MLYTVCEGSSSSTSLRRCVSVIKGATGRLDTGGEGTDCESTDAGEGEDAV
jgi:hypothetical protein